jgi:hypothetical protein
MLVGDWAEKRVLNAGTVDNFCQTPAQTDR